MLSSVRLASRVATRFVCLRTVRPLVGCQVRSFSSSGSGSPFQAEELFGDLQLEDAQGEEDGGGLRTQPAKHEASDQTPTVTLPWEVASSSSTETQSPYSFLDKSETKRFITAQMKMCASHTEVFDLLRENEEDLDVIMYRAAVSQLGFRLRKWKLALKVFHQMLSRSSALKIDKEQMTQCYDLIISVLLSNNVTNAGMGYFQKFLKLGLKPSHDLLTKLLEGLGRQGHSAAANDVFRVLMTDTQMNPTAKDYRCLISSHTREGLIDSAYAIYKYALSLDWANEVMPSSIDSQKSYLAIGEDCTNGEYLTSGMISRTLHGEITADRIAVVREVTDLAMTKGMRLNAAAKNSILRTYLAENEPEMVVTKFKELFSGDMQDTDSYYTYGLVKNALLKMMVAQSGESVDASSGTVKKLVKTLEKVHRIQMEKFGDELSANQMRMETRKWLFGKLFAHRNDWRACVPWLKEFLSECKLEVWQMADDSLKQTSAFSDARANGWVLDVAWAGNLGARVLLRHLFTDANSLALMRERLQSSASDDADNEQRDSTSDSDLDSESEKEAVAQSAIDDLGAESLEEQCEEGEDGSDRIEERVWNVRLYVTDKSPLAEIEADSLREAVIDELNSWKPPLKVNESQSPFDADYITLDSQCVDLFFDSTDSGDTNCDNFCADELKISV